MTTLYRNAEGAEGQSGRFVVRVANQATGEILELDSQLARVRRLRSRVCAWANYVRLVGLSKLTMKMVTLTYAPGEDGAGQWREGHISEFIRKVRRHCGSKLAAYAWVAELQERGEVHYHCLLVVRSGCSLPYPDKAGWWPHGMSRIETARSPGYVVKYTQKAEDDAIFPKGLRLYCVWISKEFRTADYEALFRVTVLPGWLRPEALKSEEWPKRASGGGWWVNLFGVAAVIVSPWVLLSVSALARAAPG